MLTSILSLIAYIGPGAGFATAVSFLTRLVALWLGLATLLFWPFRILAWLSVITLMLVYGNTALFILCKRAVKRRILQGRL